MPLNIANIAPIIPSEKAFYEHSMHYHPDRYAGIGTICDAANRSTISSDTRFWVRADNEGGAQIKSFLEIDSKITSGTIFNIPNLNAADCGKPRVETITNIRDANFFSTSRTLHVNNLQHGDTITLYNSVASTDKIDFNGNVWGGSSFTYQGGRLVKTYFIC